MKKFAATFVLVLATASAAHAQPTRTWVSGVGDDVNPCSRTAPCKTWAGAISKTAAAGEISALDPGGFGAVTITKSITLNGDGTLAGILASLTNGVIINAGASDKIVLRNLSINGAGNGTNGIRFLAGQSLTVDSCTISGFTGRGIEMNLSIPGKMVVRNTRITNTLTGIFVTNTSLTGGKSKVELDHVALTTLTNGLEVGNNGRATISESYISANTGSGILASAANALVFIDGCQVSYNEVAGVNAAVSGAIVRLADSEIYNNNIGINIAAGAIVESAGDNRVASNASSMAPNGVLPIQ